MKDRELRQINDVSEAVLLIILAWYVWITDHATELTGICLLVAAAAKAYVAVKEAIKK